MEDDGVRFNGSFSGSSVEEVRLEGEDPTCQPETAGAADDGQLAVLVKYGVAAKDGEGAAVGEGEGEVVDENHFFQGCRRRNSLRVADVGGGNLRPLRQRIVPYHSQSEARRRCRVRLCDYDAGGGGAA